MSAATSMASESEHDIASWVMVFLVVMGGLAAVGFLHVVRLLIREARTVVASSGHGNVVPISRTAKFLGDSKP